MSKRKPWKPSPREHVKRLEVNQSREHWPVFLNEIKKQVHADAQAEHDRFEVISMATCEGRRNWLMENKPNQYERIRKTIDHDKAVADRVGDTNVHYDGDIRVTMVTKDYSGIFRRMRKAGNLSMGEADILWNNMDRFPNLRIEHCPWTNTSVLKWDE